jgi:alpha-tubulin suppressor-like RCC1 family protein
MSHLPLAVGTSVGLNLLRLSLGISGSLSLVVPLLHAASPRAIVVWGEKSAGISDVPAGLNDVTAIDAGDYHTLALKSDGTVVAWGVDYNGQPTVPPGVRGVTAIAAGFYNSIALKRDGAVVPLWESDFNTGVEASLSGVTAIAAGFVHNLALKDDGTVVAWGWEYHADEGYYPFLSKPVAGLSGVTAIAAGGAHSVALRRDGTVVTWASSNVGMLTDVLP